MIAPHAQQSLGCLPPFAVAQRQQPADFRHSALEFLSPAAYGRTPRRNTARELHHELRVIPIREKFNLTNPRRNASRSSALPQRLDRAINQRRTDWTLFHRQQFMRPHLEVPSLERRGLHLQSRPVAIIPWRRSVHLDLAR